MTELSWWYIVILIDPQSIKDISSLTPTPNLVIFICSCHSGLGEQECQPFLSTACEMRPMASDHWLNRVPGDLHPQWVRSTDRCYTFGKCHLLKASEVSWTHSMTAVIRLLSSPGITLGGCSQSSKAESLSPGNFLKMPIPSSTHCLLNRILGGIHQFIF